MSATEMTPDEVTKGVTDDTDNLVHVFCCRDEDLGLCGVDLTDANPVDDVPYDNDCIVCDELQNLDEKKCCQCCPFTMRSKW